MNSKKKYIVCLGDGMADEACSALNGLTPLEKASIPTIDLIAKKGKTGLVHTVPAGCHPGSDVANMGLLGYDPRQFYTGRGPIEAVAMGIQVPKDKWVFRCNLVCLSDENGVVPDGPIHFKSAVMKSFTADHISSEEADQLLKELQQKMDQKSIQFFTGVSYRHIVLLSDQYHSVTCSAPHDASDKQIDPFLPKGKNEQEIFQLMHHANEILRQSKVNKKRIQNGKLPANSIWPWSQGKIPTFPSFQEKYGLSGGIITAVDLLKGLAKLTGLKAPFVQGATGFVDTNYKNKIKEAFSILKEHDFVYIHIEAPDEAGHLGDAILKTKAIEDFDQNVMKPVWQYVQNNPNTALLILPDHPTPCRTKTHTSNPVPFVYYDPNIIPDQTDQYTEKTVSDWTFEFPWELMQAFLDKKPVNV